MGGVKTSILFDRHGIMIRLPTPFKSGRKLLSCDMTTEESAYFPTDET